MAVYTPLHKTDFIHLLKRYDIGELVSYQGIDAGIENSNFFLTTRSADDGILKQWVVTLFENVIPDDQPFFNNLTAFLQGAGFTVPAPLADKNGYVSFDVRGKSGVIVPRIAGSSIEKVNEHHCGQVGVYVAKMHLALQGFDQKRPVERTLKWMLARHGELQAFLTPPESALLDAALQRYQDNLRALDACPQGIIHGDLFRDNVLFVDDQVSGIIDFYHSGQDALLYDLAVIVNDWAVQKNGAVIEAKETALLAGYAACRPLTLQEQACWPHFKALAALRFWLSRLRSRHLPGYQTASVQGDKTKDPDEMRRILEACLNL